MSQNFEGAEGAVNMANAESVGRFSAAGTEIPVRTVHTVVVGSGAASLKCADRLHAYGITDLAVITERLGGGTSNNSGSDKQTYYKLATASPEPDSPYAMAEDLFNGGAMHGDIALAEALGSPDAFHALVSIGVPFPRNRYGGFTGYKTDHDPRQRATSAGPWTSNQMFRTLLAETRRRGIPIYDRHEAIAILVDGGRACGVLALDLDRLGEREFGLVLFRAENVVFGTGGPGGIYATSVYPEGHTGSIGIALEAGAAACNLTESQYGLASTKFRWNVSGTYQQVIPRYVSTASDGSDPREFLNDFFPDMGKLAGAVFRKGYQWPFDPRKIEGFGSSLVDILVYIETREKGRRVFMDFTRNPEGDARIGGFSFDNLDPEAREYLTRSDALLATPIERLSAMNPQAIRLYREHGIDIEREPLEIAVCAQHNNGGLAGDLFWESVNIRHFFPVGEVNGSHGVYRPGGSALNSGQVGAQRAAEKIARAYGEPTLDDAGFRRAAERAASGVLARIRRLLEVGGGGRTPEEYLDELRTRMSRSGAHIRGVGSIAAETEAAEGQVRDFERVGIRGVEQLPEALRVRHLAIAHAAYLASIRAYIDMGGGSRGSYLILDAERGIRLSELLDRAWSHRPEEPSLREILLLTELDGLGDRTGTLRFRCRTEPRRPIPAEDFWFERVWSVWQEGGIYAAGNGDP